jgi:hypothetical protein
MKQYPNGYAAFYSIFIISFAIIILTLLRPRITAIDRMLVRVQAQQLHSLCLYLQQRALVSQEQQELYVDVHNNRYETNTMKQPLPQGVVFNFIAGSYGPPSSPSSAIVQPITFSHSKIIFYPDGMISSGTIYLTDKSRTTMYALTSGIAQISYLRLYKYQQDKWAQIL